MRLVAGRLLSPRKPPDWRRSLASLLQWKRYSTRFTDNGAVDGSIANGLVAVLVRVQFATLE